MEISSKYNPAEVEGKWYEYWMENNLFHSEPDEREPYTIVIPPPNVTGILHMGHMLNNTIQDILVRRARMQGKNACWVPGTDHASIATEAKVVAKLAAEGIKKSDLSREEFLVHAWDWTHKHGGMILEQLKKLGASCDWVRTCFTMDKIRSESVISVFVDLYNKGLIYRGVRMVNWDPQALTALSDEEVVHKEVNGKMYYLRYKIAPPNLPQGEENGGESFTPDADKLLYTILRENAEEQRKFSTEAESILWNRLRSKQIEGNKFRRQHIIESFIVDFVCLSKQLIIEVDGGYHNNPGTKEWDELRTSILEENGYHILRFTNEEVVADTETVISRITDTLRLPQEEDQGGGRFTPHAKPKYQTADKLLYTILRENAEEQRKFSTEAESILWNRLRSKQIEGNKFRRQHIIESFIVDFVCLSKQLIIEVDGGYHNNPGTKEWDELRTSILEENGYHILRFTNEEVVADTETVISRITDTLRLPLGEVGRGYAVVATTRPETIMGDTALCIHPHNPKTAHLKGKRVIVPLVNRSIPVIEDEYVDIDFGTGCLKVTPAHDINDYVLGEKYNLPSIDIFNDNGTLNQNGAMYAGMDRFDVRKQIEKDLEAAGLLEKTEAYTNKVGFSERTNAVIEPKLSMQWFLKMEDIAKPALDAVENDTIKFHPQKYKNTYRHWMENIKDWCISRQLWWGHQIPAYYAAPLNPPTGETARQIIIVAENEEKAREIADKHPYLGGTGGGYTLCQDEDCLDTWFSSWLWPISVFDGINCPDNKEISYYYPTNDLVTAPDIIFFWVARMIMSGYEYRHAPCFDNVYFTGIVRDIQGRKMSKQLGNSPDPIELMEKYGADGVRMGMLLSSAAGNDLLYDDSLCEQGRNFNNKIWNAFRLVKGWEVAPANSPEEEEIPTANKIAIAWFEAQMNKTIAEMDDLFAKYRLSEALMLAYKLFWDEFSSWYLELVKPPYQQPIDQATHKATLSFFDSLLRLLHPFMPFITEELWQALSERKSGESIMISPLPKAGEADENLIADFETAKQIIAGVRTIRLQKNIPNKNELALQIIGNHNSAFDPVIAKMANLLSIQNVSEKTTGAIGFLVGTTEFAVPMGDKIDVEAELEKLKTELVYTEGFLQSVTKKLSNDRFVQNAKPEIVENERKKQADAENKIALLKENIEALRFVLTKP